ncbi:MAG: ArsR/SmtB family transcription factor [Halobacteriota archaeon]
MELRLLKCMANDTRFQILKLLEEKEMCVCEIMETLDKEQSVISHHLQRLRECGLIQKRVEGQKRIYSLADPTISEVIKRIRELSHRVHRGEQEQFAVDT